MTVFPTTADEYQAMCADDNSRLLRDHYTGHGDLWPLPSDGRWWRKTRYEFTNDARDPLTWHAQGLQARPDRHIAETDLGSVPRIVQIIPALSKDRYARSYIMHDSAYLYGGWYVRQADGAFRFVRLSRDEADEWLYRGIIAEGGRVATARTVWAAVRIGGRLSWDPLRQAEARYHAGITVAG
jgi:hypothetical protein